MEKQREVEVIDDEYSRMIKNELSKCQLKLKEYPALLTRAFKTIRSAPDTEACPDDKQMGLRVMQYNILADALATQESNFDRVPGGCLKWPFRKDRILEQILLLSPDVICLQEVDHFSDFFEPFFDELGYEGCFFQKKDSPCLRCKGNSGPDGIAMFYRKNKFSLLESERKYLENVEKGESNQPIMICMLKDKEAEKNICFSVTHFKAKKGFENLRTAQARSSLKSIEGFRARVDPESAVVFCGDFNGVPSEDFYEAISHHNGGLLKSAYLIATGQEIAYTTWKIRQDLEVKHAIDYIWYSHELLEVASYLELPDEKEIPEARLPSYSSPSDHLPLCCDFVLKK